MIENGISDSILSQFKRLDRRLSVLKNTGRLSVKSILKFGNCHPKKPLNPWGLNCEYGLFDGCHGLSNQSRKQLV